MTAYPFGTQINYVGKIAINQSNISHECVHGIGTSTCLNGTLWGKNLNRLYYSTNTFQRQKNDYGDNETNQYWLRQNTLMIYYHSISKPSVIVSACSLQGWGLGASMCPLPFNSIKYHNIKKLLLQVSACLCISTHFYCLSPLKTGRSCF